MVQGFWWHHLKIKQLRQKVAAFLLFFGGLTVLEREITQSGCLLLTGDSTFRIFHLIRASKKLESSWHSFGNKRI